MGISFLSKLQVGNLKLSETATGNVHENNVFFKDSQISQGIYNSRVTNRVTNTKILFYFFIFRVVNPM